MAKSVSPLAIFKWATENDCAELPAKEQRERYMAAQKGTNPAKPREKRVYSTVLVLNDGRTLVLPDDSERASNAAIAALSLLASHGIDYSEVASVVRAPAMSFEEFAGSDE
jgi:hypothetical protein